MGIVAPHLVGTLSEIELPVTKPNTAVAPASVYAVEPEIPIPPPLSWTVPSTTPSALASVTPAGTVSQASAVVPAPVQAALGMGGSWELGALMTPEPASSSAAAPQFTAEHAVDFLSNLPHCLDEQERCGKVQELFKGLTHDESALAAGLVEEAAEQIVTIRQNLRGIEVEFQREQADDELCIQVLEERLVRLRRQVRERQEGMVTQRRELKTRLDEMMGVIVFFDRYQGFLRQQKQAPMTETPAFMRDDTVKNLLKHNGRLAFV